MQKNLIFLKDGKKCPKLWWQFPRTDCDAPCFEQLKATHLRASPKQQALLDVLLQLIKKWPLTIGPWQFLCKLTTQSNETYGKINHVLILLIVNRLGCESEKWADMGTCNIEWPANEFLRFRVRIQFTANCETVWWSICLILAV